MTLRVAVVGYGLAGSVFHAPLVDAAAGMRVSSVVTGNPERQAQIRSAHPDAEVLESVDVLWDRADQHDLVVVATTNDVHVSVARSALDVGLPVVVDKPLAVTEADARALVQRARERDLMLTVFQNRRWDSDQLTLRRLLAEGVLGTVHRYESRFERWRPEVSPGKWRESLTADQGGGILLDLGSHLVDQAVALFGPVARVYGEVQARRGGSDDVAFLALTHESGIVSHLSASMLAGSPGPRLRVLGDRAAFVLEPLDGQEDALRAGRRPTGDESWGTEPEQRWGRLVRGDTSEPVRSERGRWDLFYAEVERCLREATPPPVDASDAVHVLAVLEAARHSAATGQTASLPPPP